MCSIVASAFLHDSAAREHTGSTEQQLLLRSLRRRRGRRRAGASRMQVHDYLLDGRAPLALAETECIRLGSFS